MTRNKHHSGHPPWLKAMQNATIGEARARAFLLDRFWVLERSVDVHGTDFIIQRRITGINLLDREPPRFGVIQVKFFGTPTTYHFVHREYVVDENDQPRNEFFLICHAGNEEYPRQYIITGEDLHTSFPKTKHNGNEGYSISLRQLTSDNRYEVRNAKRTLDRIERQLQMAEFTTNRRFMSWALPSAASELGAIAPEYAEPIDNWWGDIPEEFEQIRKSACKAMVDVEEIYNLIKQITEETDPLVAEEYISEIKYNCLNGHGIWSIRLPNDWYSEDFFTVCRRHKRIVDLLREDGLLDAFLGMKDALRESIMKFLEPHLPLGPDVVHRFSLLYNPKTFELIDVISRLDDLANFPELISEVDDSGIIKVDVLKSEMVEKAVPGQIDYRWLPGRYTNRLSKEENLADSYRLYEFWLYYVCLDAAFELKYYDIADT